jgi:hypothetical protein
MAPNFRRTSALARLKMRGGSERWWAKEGADWAPLPSKDVKLLEKAAAGLAPR